MVMALKERSTDDLKRESAAFAATAASVKMKESMVAMFGMIIPAPFATPAIVYGTPPATPDFTTHLGKVSVVMIAAANCSTEPLPTSATRPGNAVVKRSIGSGTPITPVEQT